MKLINGIRQCMAATKSKSSHLLAQVSMSSLTAVLQAEGWQQLGSMQRGDCLQRLIAPTTGRPTLRLAMCADVQIAVGSVALAVAYISTQKPATSPAPPQPSSTADRAITAAERAITPGTAVGQPAAPSVISSLDQEARKSTATYWNRE